MSKRLSASSASALIAILILGTVLMAQPAGLLGQRENSVAVALGSDTAVVNVTVTDNVGRPMDKAEVRLMGGSIFWLTDENGTAQITGLYANDTAPGTSYNFTASLTGYRPTVTQAWILANITTNVTILVEGGTILGRVMSKGVAITGVNVSISALGYYNITNSEGTYQLNGVPGGTHAVTASKTGYDNETETVALSVGGVYLRDFSLTQQTGSISGFVTNFAGVPLQGASVTIRVDLSTITVPTNATGFYDLVALPEGVYSVTASMNGFYSNSTDNVPVTRGNKTEDVNFTLTEKPNRLYGVVKAGTLLLPGVNVSIVGTALHNISNYEGSYEISNVTAGIYNVSASLSGYVTNVTQVTILSGTDLQVLINLQELPGSQLLIKVTGSDTVAALVGVVITISGKDIEPLSQSTNIDGLFAFTGLKPGNYTLQLIKEGYKPIEMKWITVGEGEQTLSLTMEPLRSGDTGFIFGFDMAHSMMILALFLTIIILAMAVWLRIKTFQAPESAPAVYDEEPEEEAKSADGSRSTEDTVKQPVSRTTTKSENGQEKNGKDNKK